MPLRSGKLGYRSYSGGHIICARSFSGYSQGAGSPFTPLNSTKVYGSSFYSVTGNVKPVTGEFSNNNLYYTGNPGTVYNAASGLGFANLSQLAHVLAAAG